MALQGEKEYLWWRRRGSSVVLVLIASFACSYSEAFVSRVRGSSPSQRHHSSTLQATSSRDLKKTRRSKKKKEDAVKRLARTAATAASLYPPKLEDEIRPSSIGSLQQLTQAIDEQLIQANQRNTQFVSGVVQQPRDSMSSLLGYNDQQTSQPGYHVALVFGKALLQDQVSVEYASRIRALVKLIATDSTITLVCFCGGVAPGNHIADADAAYVFFRHLCASQNIGVDHLEVYIDRTSREEASALQHLTQYLRTHQVPQWLQDSSTEESSTDEYGLVRETPRKKIHVHFSLVSTGHHLCNINDIHHRSPRQSLLRPIEQLKSEMSRVEQAEEGIVETSWCYCYAPYPCLDVKDDAVAFMGRCYLLGEELKPLLMNLKGIVNEKEFFQRDNYLVLASIRRSLVAQMEELYKTKPSLRSDLKRSNINVVMEGAVLSLGRCIDLVRPAGLLVGSVSKADFTKALRALEHATTQIRAFCDPDTPLDPSEWGKLIPNEGEDEGSSEHQRLYTLLDTAHDVMDDESSEEGHVEDG